MTNYPPKKFIDFIITQKCTYRCKYCSQSKLQTKKMLDASDKTINSFLEFLDRIDNDFEITITGGEAMLHPRFFELIEQIKHKTFKINLISNFSFNIENYLKVFAMLDESLNRFDLSFHLTEIKDFDLLIDKLIVFLDKKPKNTNTVFLIPEYEIDFIKQEKINKLIEIADKYNIPYEFQKIRILNKYQDENVVPEKSFAKNCYAGCYSAVIYENGEVYRCYSSRFLKTNYLGNIKNKRFKLNKALKPCPMQICTCPKPLNYNQITNTKNYFRAYFNNVINIAFMPFYILKNSQKIKIKVRQFLETSKSNFSLF